MENYLQTAKNIVLQQVANQPIKVYLFGSRAKNTARRNSDIDIALLSNKIDISVIASQLRENFEESSTPYQVDIVDLNSADEAMKQKILKEAISWKE